MTNDLKSIFLAGIGSIAYTYDKASKIVDDLVKKGKLTIDEGKELSSELKRTVVEKHQAQKNEKPLTKEDMISVLKEMNFATKDDLNEIKERLGKLEAK